MSKVEKIRGVAFAVSAVPVCWVFVVGSSIPACSESTKSGNANLADSGEVDATPPAAEDPARWQAAGKLKVPRSGHTATLLLDGSVLIVGGAASGKMLAEVELFEPSTGAFRSLPPLPEGRSHHTATLLGSGKVLIAGGGHSNVIAAPDGTEVRSDALLYDPESGTVAKSSMTGPRHGHSATRLDDTHVLIAGGADDESVMVSLLGGSGKGPVGRAIATAEIYDADANTWTPVGSLVSARFLHTATRLQDGRVLVTGGATEANDVASLRTAELFDPATKQWKATGSFVGDDRFFHRATLLGTGAVLVAGGKKSGIRFLDTAELFDGASGTWSATANTLSARSVPSLVTLQSGRGLVVGGIDCGASGCASLTNAEIYDAESATWTKMAPLKHARSLHTATVLDSGEVLVVGGGDSGELIADAELAIP